MQRPRLLPSSAVLLLLAACSAPSASVTPMLGALGLDGSFAASDSGTSSVASSFADLDLDSTEAAPGAKAQLGFLGAQLSVSAFQTEYEGSGTTSGDITLGGTTISGNTAVDSELDLLVARALFTWNLIPVGPVELGIGLGLSLIDFDLVMREELTGDTLESDEALPVPLLAVRAGWTWGPVKVRGELGGLTFEYDGDEAQVIDGDVEASVALFDAGSLVVGYRLLDVEAEYEDEGDSVEADLELAGWYLGVRFSF